ncbi:hypothetical protein GA0070616_1828 [Micromonospora nigra]|uniref:Uncharacterized protein n=1 Tax=Micromonospora nigra TaxID=145857 RepID=A0A1C6RRJ8_9ACTN|nr:hypothetical protein [Micromonospora nigra]SCL19807.1 hypothetical protein GA0070616_1828 [Micromonospora nigra]
MAFRTWGRLLLTALGVSVLAGAGQLGVAFGFGIVRLTGAFTGDTVNQWPAQLVWVGWFAANAAVAGAVLTDRLARRNGQLAGTGGRLAVVGAAALGATVVAPLCMQPARNAELVFVDPVWAIGICAVLGAVAGAGAALAVLVRPPVGWNLAVLAGAVWLLALMSVGPSLGADGPLRAVRLGVLEPPGLSDDATQRLALLVPPTVALLAGAATGALARWRGHPPLVSIPAGVAGPVLVAFAYLTSGPGDAADRYQLSPYYGALIAVATGALGSAAAALLPGPATWPPGLAGGTRAGSPDPGAGTVGRSGEGTPEPAVEPTDILQPLPPGPPLPRAATTPTGGPADTVGADLVPRPDNRGTPEQVIGGPRSAPPHWDWPSTGAGPTAGRPAPTDGPAPADVVAPHDSSALDEVTASDEVTAPDEVTPPDEVTAPTGGAPDAAPPTDTTPGPAASPAAAPPPIAAPSVTPSPPPAPAGSPPDLPVDHEPAGQDVTGQPPRPRHHALLPDLNRASTWDAFGTVHRSGPARRPRTGPPAAPPTGVDAPFAADTDPVGNTPEPSAGKGGVTPQFPDPSVVARDLTAAFANPPAAAKTPPAAPAPPPAGADTADPANGPADPANTGGPGNTGGDRGRARRGLFRRPKLRAGQDRPAERDGEPLPDQDEEYVDWVAGLSRPVADNEPAQESGRRSLRSSGRHHES